MTPFTIRPATVADADAIAQVHHQSWEETYPGLMPPELLERMTLDHRLRQWRRIIHDMPDGGARFVAEQNGKMIAIAQCGAAREAELQAPWEIWMVYVLREAQGIGVGAALMRAMFDHLKNLPPRGDGSVALWTLALNARAVRYYEKLGARRIGAIKRDERMGVAIEDVAMRWEREPSCD